jgi:transglutaminase-like putative cysteine protease
MVPGRVGETEAAERPPVIRLVAFAVLGLYGTARWSTLISGGTHGRLAGLLGLALLLAAGRPLLAGWSRPLAAAATVVVLIAVFPVAGVPFEWVRHVRIAVTARAIGEGLSALPQALVPYTGVNPWVRLDITLGGAVLLFDAALLVAFAPGRMSDIRKAAAALPLVALIAVPSTLSHPRSPYLDGFVLFLMLAAFVLADRITSRQAAGALALCLITAVTAMLIAPAFDRQSPWLDYWSFAGGLVPKRVDTFNWSQTYGPVRWPHSGRTVLEIQAARPSYWKTEDLDVFDGQRWTQGIVPGQSTTPAPSPRWVAKWSQTIEVTVRNMRSSELVGAGVSSPPARLGRPVLFGFGVGTWITGSQLEPGDSYAVRVYAPAPSASQLNAAGADYAGLSSGYRTILLPPRTAAGAHGSAQIVFPVFHSTASVQNVIGSPAAGSAASLLGASPYGSAYGLALRLARAAPTPYAFVMRVEGVLAHGYTYTLTTPVHAYPLASFLFDTKRGYCQQFAGAMALLLRMGGVPARVAVGFTQGQKDPATGRWLVTDLDAHAWVEAWFPHYGWVKFDPTPPADPALSGNLSLAGGAGGAAAAGTGLKAAGGFTGAHLRIPGSGSVRPRGGVSAVAIAAPAGAVTLVLLALLLTLTRPLPSVEARVAELERALNRSQRPVGAPVTLAGIEHNLRDAPEASAYIRALRLARFGHGHAPPTSAQRRALRRRLARGHGPLGRLRTLWALPPRRRRAGA